ncbi:hypothetical protein E8E13_004077 [Curvularia kusanoi]|uniref:Cytochrome b561 domain-containing protein n=1 Tax=Curvularia kusanoi TaxID=90978 RepID=A0A9P4TGD2_CURKU|nr:hypothetical protein E8E13_004077 [Curvularia kusanoi]
MSNQGLSAPGSSVYTSDSMYVGDGTWDSQRNTFLLPNLMGINFDTMRYNGMGNRFRNMAGYKPLITAHGILAAITFLFVVPGAIFMARFYHRNPRLALRVHIWLQVLTLLLATAIIVLGFQAVGPERSLTNPHHGIGVALYTLVVVQVLGGSIIHHVEKGKERFKVPLKLILHQWIGRTVLLLGIAQIPLGLTLWGSPKVLFILFAVWAFLLLIIYFVLSYRNQPEMGFDDNTTYITERTASTRSRRSRGGRGIGALATAGAAGAGLAALASSRSRSRSRRHGDETTVLSSRPHSRSRVTDSQFTESYISDEKYGGRHRETTWRDRLLGAGAAAGGIFALKSLFGKKKDRRAYTETSTGSDVSYGRPLGQSEVTQTDLSRLEEGRAPDSPVRNQDWRRVEEREAAQAAAMGASPMRAGHRPTRSGGSIDSFDSRTSFNDHNDGRPLREETGYGVKDGIMTLGVLGFMKHTWNKRKNRKEDARIEDLRQQDIEEEKMARANSTRRRFTGDGAPPRRHNGPPSTIYSETEISGMTPSVARPSGAHPPTLTSSTAGPSVLRPADNTIISDSGSEAYISPGGRSHRRHRNSAGAAALAGGAVAAASGSPSRRRNSRDESIASPPVSVKVKMHNDGRHVTLRRLNEEEAAAEREARRRERQRRTRTGSMSSLSQLDGDRWRRTEALEAQQAQEMAQAHGAMPPPPSQPGAPLQMPEPYIPPPPPGPPPNFGNAAMRPPTHGDMPPPPPIPAVDPSILSSPQGTQVYGTETDVSNYDTNRRRRRAERAQAKQARSGGSRVEFS